MTALAVQQTRRAARRKDERTGPLWWAGQIVSWLLLLSVLALAALMIVLPRLAGGTAYTVLTGSMSPAYPPGTLVVTVPVESSDIRLGDVLTYQLRSGEAAVVTHRVAGLGVTTSGEQRFTLRGDANTVDDAPIKAEQVRGRLWYAVPYAGYVNTAVTGHYKGLLLGLAVSGLSAYSLVMAVGAVKDRRRLHSSAGTSP